MAARPDDAPHQPRTEGPPDAMPGQEAVAPEAEPVDERPSSGAKRGRRPAADRVLEAKIAALESVIARSEDTWEPDGDGDPGFPKAVRAMEWRGAARPSEPAEPYRLAPEDRSDLPQVRTADGPGAVAALTDLVDEDMLRDIVAEIVREELRGALGERITRNVRKLVRREILRAVERPEGE